MVTAATVPPTSAALPVSTRLNPLTRNLSLRYPRSRIALKWTSRAKSVVSIQASKASPIAMRNDIDGTDDSNTGSPSARELLIGIGIASPLLLILALILR